MGAGLLWAAFAASFVLATLGLARRSGLLMVLGGLLGLAFAAAAMLSIGRFVILVPFLELAIGIGFLTKARASILWILGGVAVGLYIAQLAVL
jgi:hypothetical protein